MSMDCISIYLGLFQFTRTIFCNLKSIVQAHMLVYLYLSISCFDVTINAIVFKFYFQVFVANTYK